MHTMDITDEDEWRMRSRRMRGACAAFAPVEARIQDLDFAQVKTSRPPEGRRADPLQSRTACSAHWRGRNHEPFNANLEGLTTAGITLTFTSTSRFYPYPHWPS